MMQSWRNDLSISVRGCVIGSEEDLVVSGVYGPCVSNLKEAFFQELADIRRSWNGSWCLCEDFNEIIYVDD